jgi:hypothetical protein
MALNAPKNHRVTRDGQSEAGCAGHWRGFPLNETSMDNKPRPDRNGEMAHLILATPESWRRRNLHGSTGLSSGSQVESITFLKPPEKFNEPVAERQAQKRTATNE